MRRQNSTLIWGQIRGRLSEDIDNALPAIAHFVQVKVGQGVGVDLAVKDRGSIDDR